jgi:nucleotide-binding universal stress UspA family protein
MSVGFSHIACCLDESEGSREALREASRLRELSGGRLSVVHVLEALPPRVQLSEGAAWLGGPGEVPEDAAAWLAEETRDVPEAEPVVLAPGHAPAAVCSWAAGAGVDLLVASAHRGLLERALLGSFAGYLARHAPCATLLTHPPARAAGAPDAGLASPRAAAPEGEGVLETLIADALRAAAPSRRVVGYLARQVRLGRHLDAALGDPYVINRTTAAERARLVEDPVLVAAWHEALRAPLEGAERR